MHKSRKLILIVALSSLLIVTPGCSSQYTNSTPHHSNMTKINRESNKLTASKLGLGTTHRKYLSKPYVHNLSLNVSYSSKFRRAFLHKSRLYYKYNADSPDKAQLHKYTHHSIKLLTDFHQRNSMYQQGWLSSNPVSRLRPVKQWKHNQSYKQGFHDGAEYYNGQHLDSNDLFNQYIETGGIKD